MNDLLVPGTRLPPERSMAASLGVSRPTVTSALDDLRSEGLLEARQGSGTWIASASVRSTPTLPMADLVFAGHGINLAAATPQDASHLGPLSVTLADLLGTTPSHGIDPGGLFELRARVAQHLALEGSVRHQAEDVVITNGSHHALALIIATLVDPGDRVVVESHTYGGIIDLLTYRRAKPVVVERDHEGILPGALRRVLKTAAPRLVYWMPRAHAPTGTVTSEARYREVNSILTSSNAVVVEDDTLADVRLGQRPPTIVTGPDVIRIGSLSKLAWGGLRIGWIQASPSTVGVLLRNRARTDLGTSIAAQMIAMQVFDQFEELCERRLDDLKRKRDYLCGILTEEAPAWEFSPSAAGLSLWVRLPVRDSQAFARSAATHGVHVMPGVIARPDRKNDAYIRICFDRNVNILTEGVERLMRAWKQG